MRAIVAILLLGMVYGGVGQLLGDNMMRMMMMQSMMRGTGGGGGGLGAYSGLGGSRSSQASSAGKPPAMPGQSAGGLAAAMARMGGSGGSNGMFRGRGMMRLMALSGQLPDGLNDMFMCRMIYGNQGNMCTVGMMTGSL